MGHLQDWASLHDPSGRARSLGRPKLVRYVHRYGKWFPSNSVACSRNGNGNGITDSGNGRTATAKRLQNNGNVMVETRHTEFTRCSQPDHDPNLISDSLHNSPLENASVTRCQQQSTAVPHTVKRRAVKILTQKWGSRYGKYRNRNWNNRGKFLHYIHLTLYPFQKWQQKCFHDTITPNSTYDKHNYNFYFSLKSRQSHTTATWRMKLLGHELGHVACRSFTKQQPTKYYVQHQQLHEKTIENKIRSFTTV